MWKDTGYIKYTYARGRRYRSGMPYGGSGLDNSVDRISEVLWDVVDATTPGLGIAAHRTRNYLYKPGSSTAVLVSTTYEAVDGDDTKTVRFGRTTTWQRAEGTTYGDGVWSETTTNVDGTASKVVFISGKYEKTGTEKCKTRS